MSHIEGHPVIDRLAHTFGIAKPHNHTPAQTENTSSTEKSPLKDGDSLKVNKTNTSNLKVAPQVSFGHTHTEDVAKKYAEWVPFKSSKTGAAVGAMSGQIFGVVAGFGSAAAIAGISKDYKMALAVGAGVYIASLGAGAVGGAVGYKTRGMNIDTTEPPMGTMLDTPEQAKKNMEAAQKKWDTVFKK